MEPNWKPLEDRLGAARQRDPPLERTSDSQKIAQHRDERLVGGRHRVIGEARRAHPGEALAFAGRDGPRPFAAEVKRHQQMKFGIGVRGEGERRQTARRDIDPELLAEFADQRRFGRLAGLDLAARKFPQAREMLARGALGEQDPAIGIDEMTADAG